MMPVETPGDWTEMADTDGQYAIACAIMALVQAIDRLGNADAATPMGAIEGLAARIGDKIDGVSAAISGLVDD